MAQQKATLAEEVERVREQSRKFAIGSGISGVLAIIMHRVCKLCEVRSSVITSQRRSNGSVVHMSNCKSDTNRRGNLAPVR